MRKMPSSAKKIAAVPEKPCEVRQGDCVAGMLAMPAGCASLAVADPPYNQGMVYNAYEDKKPYAEYMDWTKSWLAAATHALHKTGSLWIFVPDEWVSEVDLMTRKDFGYTKRRHVIWAFTFGQASQANFSKSHCHLLYLTRSKSKFTFNDGPLRVPSARQARYNDPRANPAGKLPDATWMLLKEQLEPYMTPDKDTWLESRVCGTYHERQPHVPNQIPMPLWDRIVLSTSNIDDLVLDPFAGSGGCGVACKRAGRRYVGFDISEESARLSNVRLAAS